MKHEPLQAAAPAAVAFTVERKPFAAAVAFLSKHVIERRNTIPILSNVVLSAAPGGGLEMTGTDLDLMARVTIWGDSTGPGTFTADAAAVADIARKADGELFDVTADDGRATFTNRRSRNTVATLPDNDFPMIAEPVAVPGAAVFTIPGDVLARDLARIAFAISKEEARYYLGGVAVQRRTVAGRESLAFVATDGARMARIARDVPEGAEELRDIILPRKLVTTLQKALKARPGADVAFLVPPTGRIAIMVGDDLYLVSKLIDGTYANWQAIDPDPAAGSQLQRLAFVDLEPTLRPADVEAFSKVLGALPAVDDAGGVFLFTAPGQPEFAGVSIKAPADGKDGSRAEYECPGWRDAHDYLLDLARSRGLDPDALSYTPEATKHDPDPKPRLPVQLTIRRGMVVGATVGRLIHGCDEWVEVPCYETFTVRHEKRAIPDSYAEGAFSIVMPRERAGMAAAVTFGTPGVDETAIRTLNGNSIELSAAAVRRLAGDVADLPRVDIPRFTMHHGAVIAINGTAVDGTGRLAMVPGAPMVKDGRKTRRMSDREALAVYCADPAGTTAALQPLYYDAPEPVEAAEPETAAPVHQPCPDLPDVARPAKPASAPRLPAGAPEPARPKPRPTPPPAATVADSEPLAPEARPADVLARLAALEAIVGGLVSRAPAALPEPANDPAPAVLISETKDQVAKVNMPDRDAMRLRHVRRYLRARAERERLRLCFDIMARELELATERAEAAEGKLWAAENRLRGADRRAGRLAHIAATQRKASRRAQDDARGAQAEARALDRKLREEIARATPSRPAAPPPSTGTMAVAFAAAAASR